MFKNEETRSKYVAVLATILTGIAIYNVFISIRANRYQLLQKKREEVTDRTLAIINKPE